MDKPYVEQNCTITHNGQEFTSGGAVITDDTLIAYISGNGHFVTDWHGKSLGKWQARGQGRGFYGAKFFYYRVTLTDGRVYNGRGQGHNMIFKGKRGK